MMHVDSIAREFDRETETTRRHLERVPEHKLDWRPHEKSFTAGGLASHIVDCVSWTERIFTQSEFDFDPATYNVFAAVSVADLLGAFDGHVAAGKQALANVVDADLMKTWQLKVKGRSYFEKPKADAFRDFTLSHLIHHRGQLSVYLRLLDVPVPGSYGPTADEGQ